MRWNYWLATFEFTLLMEGIQKYEMLPVSRLADKLHLMQLTFALWRQRQRGMPQVLVCSFEGFVKFIEKGQGTSPLVCHHT